MPFFSLLHQKKEKKESCFRHMSSTQSCPPLCGVGRPPQCGVSRPRTMSCPPQCGVERPVGFQLQPDGDFSRTQPPELGDAAWQPEQEQGVGASKSASKKKKRHKQKGSSRGPEKTGAKAAGTDSARRIDELPVYDPPQLRTGVAGGRVFFRAAVDDDAPIIARQGIEAMNLNSACPPEKALEYKMVLLAYHSWNVMPLLLQTSEQASYHQGYLAELSAYLHSRELLTQPAASAARQAAATPATAAAASTQPHDELAARVAVLEEELARIKAGQATGEVNTRIVRAMPLATRIRAAQAAAASSRASSCIGSAVSHSSPSAVPFET